MSYSLVSYLMELVEQQRRNCSNYNRAFLSVEELVLTHGRSFKRRRRPNGYRKERYGQCFKNAFGIVEDDPSLVYVEGYAVEPTAELCLQHAWVTSYSGRVIDVTWNRPGLEYFGVPLALEYVRSQILRRGKWGVFDYTSEAIRQGLPEGVVVREVL